MLKRLQEELEKDEKLKKSSLAQETLNYIETLTTKSAESIKDFLGITIDQEALKKGLDDKSKTLSELGKYMYWVAKGKKTGNMYSMSHQEAAALIIDYFTKPLPEKFTKKADDAKKAKEASKAAKANAKEYAKIEKAKEARRKKLSKLDISKISITELKEYMELFKVKGTVESVESQKGLIKVSEEDQMRAFITKHNNKPVKANKVAKKVVKEETVIDNQVSLFDEGVL